MLHFLTHNGRYISSKDWYGYWAYLSQRNDFIETLDMEHAQLQRLPVVYTVKTNTSFPNSQTG